MEKVHKLYYPSKDDSHRNIFLLAILPEDYAPLTASVMIPANTEPFEPVCFPAVFIVNDNVAEQTERFFVLLQSGNNANVGIDEYQYTVTVYIEDDDGEIVCDLISLISQAMY